MRSRRRAFALAASLAMAVTMTVGMGLVVVAAADAAASPLVACTYPNWAEGASYKIGDRVTYQGHAYEALQASTPPVGAGPTNAAVPALWKDLGACTGGTPSPTVSPTLTRTSSPSASPTRTTSPSPLPTPVSTSGTTCAVKSRPSGKVLQGYWENSTACTPGRVGSRSPTPASSRTATRSSTRRSR